MALDLKPKQPEKAKPVPAPTAAELAEYVGTYKGTTNWEVYLKDGKLLVKNEGTEYSLTASGERKFTFGSANENELVFVAGKSGRIEFIFSELYSAKKVHAVR